MFSISAIQTTDFFSSRFLWASKSLRKKQKRPKEYQQHPSLRLVQDPRVSFLNQVTWCLGCRCLPCLSALSSCLHSDNDVSFTAAPVKLDNLFQGERVPRKHFLLSQIRRRVKRKRVLLSSASWEISLAFLLPRQAQIKVKFYILQVPLCCSLVALASL